jgi:hypothetical protein
MEDTSGYKITVIKKGQTIHISYFSAHYWKVDYKDVTGFVAASNFKSDDVDLTMLSSMYFAEHPQKPKPKPEFKLGMSQSDLTEILGKPKTINTTVGSWGTHEQWVYEITAIKTIYFYFENGKLTSYQL